MGCLNTRRFVEVRFGRLKVVALCDGDAVADPVANRLDGMDLRQIGLTAGPKIVEQLWPRFDARSLDDLFQLRP